MAFGLSQCEKRIYKGDPWAPDMADFFAMLHGNSEVNFQGAFSRCLAGKPEGRVEKWVNENIGYNVRVSSHREAERMHRKWMLDGIEKESKGELKLAEEMPIALPRHSVKNLNDLKREEMDAKTGGKLHPRIQKILDAKKTN